MCIGVARDCDAANVEAGGAGSEIISACEAQLQGEHGHHFRFEAVIAQVDVAAVGKFEPIGVVGSDGDDEASPLIVGLDAEAIVFQGLGTIAPDFAIAIHKAEAHAGGVLGARFKF